MREDIQNTVNKIINSKVKSLGRASNMLWIVIEAKNMSGENIQYSFNIQCSWRVVQNKDVILATNDIYMPSQIVADSNDFDWDIFGNNKFDEKISKVNEIFFEKYIIDVKVFETGDISILIEDNSVIETFIDSSEKIEMWRFLQRKSSVPHFVVYPNKCDIE